MALLTPTQATQLNKESPTFRKLLVGDRLRAAESLQMAGRVASGHVRFTANANDTDTVTVTVGGASGVPGSTKVYEFESTGGVTAGRIAVTIAGTAALTATALATAIRANQGTGITAAAHATNTSVVDVAHRSPGATLTLATASGGRIVVQNNGGQLAPAAQAVFSQSRVITAEDVARTRVRVATGLTALDTFTYRVMVSAADNTPLAYNGAATATGGVLEFTLGSAAGILATGNILAVTAFGTAP